VQGFTQEHITSHSLTAEWMWIWAITVKVYTALNSVTSMAKESKQVLSLFF